MHLGVMHSSQVVISLALPLTSINFLPWLMASSEAAGTREGLSFSEGSFPYTYLCKFMKMFLASIQ